MCGVVVGGIYSSVVDVYLLLVSLSLSPSHSHFNLK